MTLDRRFPVGPFERPARVDAVQVARWIDEIADLPSALRATLDALEPRLLDVPYRAGGWTRRQVVQHLADSHTNSLVRFKWALTEERPTIKAYDERAWAELPDVASVPLSSTLDYLEHLHGRWVALLRALTPAQLAREFVHPASGPIDLATNVGGYAWHGRHHLAHLTLPAES
ncbi:MAG TPA: putative metal-dependent hydrolase [Planctomycetota bacterium]|nr:putative metal-dependent hydrolase [Planctomycetota bacterium]